MPELSERWDYIAILITFILITLGAFFFIEKPTIVGYTILAGYKLDTSNLNYNSSEIEIIDGVISLKPINTTTTSTQENKFTAYVTSALRYTNDETVNATEDVISLDGNITNTDKSQMFDVTFNETLDNNDKINLYLKSSDSTDIYLCDASTQCSPPGYGSVSYNGSDGWSYITISNLPQPTFTFNIDPLKVKFDYINATKTTLIEIIESTTTYPSSSSITSNDISIQDLESWQELITIHELNNQDITYEYSTDSGSTWSLVPDNKDLTSISTSTGKIRIKAILYSNETTSPTISLINVTYTIQEAPTQTEIPTYYEINDSRLVSAIANQEFIVNSTSLKTEITLTLNENITEKEINISSYASNISTPATKVKELEILAPDINNNLESATLKIHYTDEEISNLDEPTLKLYYYNETSEQWELLSSTIDKENNIITANIEHFSIYGVFGQQSPPSTPSSNTGGGGKTSFIRGSTTTRESKEEAVTTQTPESPSSAEETEQPEITEQKPPEVEEPLTPIAKITTQAIIFDRLSNPTNLFLLLLLLILVIIYIYKRKH